MTNLWYPSVKEAPIQGYSGYGGGAAGLAFRSGSVPPFENYRMFAPMNDIRAVALVGAGAAQAGYVVYPTKSSYTANTQFTSQSGSSLPTGTFFDTTATLATVFGIASNVKTYVNVTVDDVANVSAMSADYDNPDNWNYFPSTAHGVFISGFWKTDTDDRGCWKVGMGGQYAFPANSTVADKGNDINGKPQGPSSSYTCDDATGSDANTSTTGGYWPAGNNPANSGGYAKAPYMQFVFNNGLGSSVGFAIAAYGNQSDTRNGYHNCVVFRIGIHV